MLNDYPFVIVSRGSLCSKMRQYLPNAMLVIERNIQFTSIALGRFLPPSLLLSPFLPVSSTITILTWSCMDLRF